MSKMNQSKIDVRVNDNIKIKYDTLKNHYNIKGPELLEKLIENEYSNIFIKKRMEIDTKKECLMHMCIIVNSANGIDNDDIRAEIMEEVNQVCLLLK